MVEKTIKDGRVRVETADKMSAIVKALIEGD